ncbi:MAG: hydroxymethylbilane synthase [Alphaproteobacteria bacterium]
MKELKIGTRGSPLALKQAEMVKAALAALRPELAIKIEIIKTSGDWKPEHGETRLSEAQGGKGLFAKEIEQRLIAGEIDVAVHSMKDMDSVLPANLVIPWMLPREDARDAVICGYLAKNSQNINDLPKGCVIGTSSVRRGAFLLNKRPDLEVVPLRGNVQTRLDKLKAGQVDVTLLAMAGLNRLGLTHEISFAVEMGDMLPAAAQGAVGIEVRADRQVELSFIGQISDVNTVACVGAEREVLRLLDGSCHTPIGAHASLEDGLMCLRAAVCSLDGAQCYEESAQEPVFTLEEAKICGRNLGVRLKQKLPSGFLL